MEKADNDSPGDHDVEALLKAAFHLKFHIVFTLSFVSIPVGRQ